MHAYKENFSNMNLVIIQNRKKAYTHTHTHSVYHRPSCQCINYPSVLLVCPELNLKCDAVHLTQLSVTLAALTILCWTTLSFCFSFSSLSLICPHLSHETTVHPFLSISLSLSFSLHPELIHLSLIDTVDSESAQAPWGSTAPFTQPYSHQEGPHQEEVRWWRESGVWWMSSSA